MTTKIPAALLSVVLTLATGYAQNPGNRNELVIKKLESQLESALQKGDSGALERILADDYVEIDAQGGIKKKADLIRVARSMSGVQRGVVVGPDKKVDFSIRVRGDHALVVGHTTIRYQFVEYQTVNPQSQSQNPVIVDQERFIRIYSKVGERWQLVSWQTTSIAKR